MELSLVGFTLLLGCFGLFCWYIIMDGLHIHPEGSRKCLEAHWRDSGANPYQGYLKKD